jgi:hypothetical protein
VEEEFLISTWTLRVLDVTDRAAPVQLGQASIGGTAENLTVATSSTGHPVRSGDLRRHRSGRARHGGFPPPTRTSGSSGTRPTSWAATRHHLDLDVSDPAQFRH